MEKVAVPGTYAGCSKELRFAACAAAVLCIAGSPAAWGQEAGQPAELLTQAQAEPPGVRLQLQTSSVPRLDAQESGFQAPRVDMTVYPSASGTGLGAVVGVSGFATRPNAAISPFGLQPRPALDVGLRFSQRLQSQQIDITAWRRMTGDDAYTLIQQRQPVYGARVEMNLSAGKKKSGFALDRGFLGLQLESGARISIKRKDGRPMVYYRTTF